MCGCLAPYIITFCRLGAEVLKRELMQRLRCLFSFQRWPSLQAALVEVLRKHTGGKPHSGNLCCPSSSERVSYLMSCQAHPISLAGVISRMLSTCYLSPKLGFR